MVSLRIWKLVVVGVVLALFASTAQSQEKKSTQRDDMDRRAKAALALAATKTPAVAAAPAPHLPSPVKAALCTCCEVCRILAAHCDEDECGAVGRRGKVNLPVSVPAVVPEPMPPVKPAPKVESSGVIPFATAPTCANGQCQTAAPSRPFRLIPWRK